jgi:hypothetical protein
MIHYECYHISKSYNFNTKLNYIFNNMEHQALVILVAVHATMTAPILFIHENMNKEDNKYIETKLRAIYGKKK